MLGATEQELQELAVVVAGSAFWGNILHVENYDYNTFVRAPTNWRIYVKTKMNKMTSKIVQIL
jgi:hypothetical protein